MIRWSSHWLYACSDRTLNAFVALAFMWRLIVEASEALVFSLWTGVEAFTALALSEWFIVEALIALALSEQNAVRCICIARSCPKLPRVVLNKEVESNVTARSVRTRCSGEWRVKGEVIGESTDSTWKTLEAPLGFES